MPSPAPHLPQTLAIRLSWKLCAVLVAVLLVAGPSPHAPAAADPTDQARPTPGPDATTSGVLPADADAPLNLILIGLDTFRADQLGCYGNTGVQTPQIDALARESVLFERCYSPATWTLPAFTSTFTGLYPYHHGVVGGKRTVLSESIPTLTEILIDQGYHARAWVAVDYLGPRFGVTRGFDPLRTFVGTQVSKRSHRYRAELFKFAKQPSANPYFLFVHYFDAHAPYQPPNPYDRMYYQGDEHDPNKNSTAVLHEPSNRATIHHQAKYLYQWLDGVTDIEFPIQQYSAGITHTDNSVGQFIRQLRASGELDRSVVVLMADHGEHLTEHSIYFTHGLPYEENLRVPFMIRLPHGQFGGRRIAESVSLIDILPTVLELMQLPARDGLDGISLADAMAGNSTVPNRVLFAEHGVLPAKNLVKAAWNDRYRLIFNDLADGQTYELYDRRGDPRELYNLAGRDHPAEKQLRTLLWSRFNPAYPVSLTDAAAVQLDPEALERLRSLGYTQ